MKNGWGKKKDGFAIFAGWWMTVFTLGAQAISGYFER